MPWSAVHVSTLVLSLMRHDFLKCGPSSKKCFAGGQPSRLERGTLYKPAEDDWCEGAFIPKGAARMPVANIWPNRKGIPISREKCPRETNEEGHVAFGSGRRVCVGRHLANDSLFIKTTRILLVGAVTLKRTRDGNGKELPPDPNAFVGKGIITFVLLPVDLQPTSCHPASYNCVIGPWFPEVLSLPRRVPILRIKARPVHSRL